MTDSEATVLLAPAEMAIPAQKDHPYELLTVDALEQKRLDGSFWKTHSKVVVAVQPDELERVVRVVLGRIESQPTVRHGSTRLVLTAGAIVALLVIATTSLFMKRGSTTTAVERRITCTDALARVAGGNLSDLDWALAQSQAWDSDERRTCSMLGLRDAGGSVAKSIFDLGGLWDAGERDPPTIRRAVAALLGSIDRVIPQERMVEIAALYAGRRGPEFTDQLRKEGLQGVEPVIGDGIDALRGLDQFATRLPDPRNWRSDDSEQAIVDPKTLQSLQSWNWLFECSTKAWLPANPKEVPVDPIFGKNKLRGTAYDDKGRQVTPKGAIVPRTRKDIQDRPGHIISYAIEVWVGREWGGITAFLPTNGEGPVCRPTLLGYRFCWSDQECAGRGAGWCRHTAEGAGLCVSEQDDPFEEPPGVGVVGGFIFMD